MKCQFPIFNSCSCETIQLFYSLMWMDGCSLKLNIFASINVFYQCFFASTIVCDRSVEYFFFPV